MGIATATIKGFWNLILGLFTTGKYLPRKSVTLQYPDERWNMPERSRGVVVLLSDPQTGELNCNACQVCMKQCPVHAINVDQIKDPETKKRYPGNFTIDNTICCFCGICEEVCNFDAIKLTGKYEFSVFNKEELIYNKEKLQELGRDVKYTPRKKKKASDEDEKTEKKEAKPAEEKSETKTAGEKTESNPEEKDS
ncbi:MAG: NADH-quinone oxidoreductase subunit I [Candidatus Zixiibacteriota bacterium]|nr:MAG: NADH-quinone oxidoreductase subunit I [candidate division Zixibacteria bacterium]